MHTCSRNQPKSRNMSAVVVAMTRNAAGCSTGERVTQRRSSSTPTK